MTYSPEILKASQLRRGRLRLCVCLVCTVCTDGGYGCGMCIVCSRVCVCIVGGGGDGGRRGVEKGAVLGEAERGEMTCCQSELTVTAQCFSAS